MQFPLKIWEETNEGKKEYLTAADRLTEIKKNLYESGFWCERLECLRFDRECEPEVFMVEFKEKHPEYREPKNQKDALEIARKTGSTGWWGINELDKFLSGEGSIVECAMYDMGFIKYKNSWEKNEGVHNKPMEKIIDKKLDINYKDFDGKIFKKLLLLPNDFYGFGYSYELTAASNGMIFIEYIPNPLNQTKAPVDQKLFDQKYDIRFHIAAEQDGFMINAENISNGKNNGVLVTAKNMVNSESVIWPRYTPKMIGVIGYYEKLSVKSASLKTSTIYNLANDLAGRMKK